MKKLFGQCTSAVLLFLLLAMPRVASAQVIYVGPGLEIDNIKYGISQANDGDTIIVKDGTYVEDIKVYKSVVLMAENLHKAVIGDGSDFRAMISVRREKTDGVVVQGFRFAPGNFHGIIVGENSVDNSPDNCTIRNNLIEGRKDGIKVLETAANTVLEGNAIRNCTGMGIFQGGYGNNRVLNDTIENCQGPGIYIGADETPVGEGEYFLRGNVIRNNGMAGVGIERSHVSLERNLIDGNLQGIATNSDKAELVLRDSNLVCNNSEYGISVESGTVMEIRGNIISGNSLEGVRSGGHARIEKNRIEDNGEHGIHIQSGTALIKDNDIHLNKFAGIEIQGGADSLSIYDCRISRNNWAGIQCASRGHIRGNTIFENQGHGLYVAEGTYGLEAVEDTFRNNMGDEVFICNNSYATVKDCVLEEDSSRMEDRGGLSGILVEGRAQIAYNEIRNIIENGIHITELVTKESEIQNNQIEHCGNGLLIHGTSIIRFNHIIDNWNRGILIEEPAQDVTLYRNEVSGNTTGIKYMKDVPDIFLDKNDIQGNTYGIIASGAAKLRSNTIINNDTTGIIISGYGNDLGSIVESDSGKNTIAFNGKWNVFSRVSEDVPAYYNWWGLSTADSIDATIRDDNEESELGKVLFEPFLGEVVVGTESTTALPASMNVYPNPFSGQLTIRINMPEASPVKVEVIDLAGRMLLKLPQAGSVSSGERQFIWDGNTAAGMKAAPGVYLILIRTCDHLIARKVMRE